MSAGGDSFPTDHDPPWEAHFRAALRGSRTLADGYAEVEDALRDRCPRDRAAARAAFIRAVLAGTPQFGVREPGADYVARPGAYVVARDGRGRTLAVGDRAGGLSLPGGGIDPGESPSQAALRELREETGYEATLTRELGRAGQYLHAPGEGHFDKRAVFFGAELGGCGGGGEHDPVWLPDPATSLAWLFQRWAAERAREA